MYFSGSSSKVMISHINISSISKVVSIKHSNNSHLPANLLTSITHSRNTDSKINIPRHLNTDINNSSTLTSKTNSQCSTSIIDLINTGEDSSSLSSLVVIGKILMTLIAIFLPINNRSIMTTSISSVMELAGSSLILNTKSDHKGLKVAAHFLLKSMTNSLVAHERAVLSSLTLNNSFDCRAHKSVLSSLYLDNKGMEITQTMWKLLCIEVY